MSLAVIAGYGAAWLNRPRSRDDELIRALTAQSEQTSALAAQLRKVQAQLHELQATPSMAAPSASPAGSAAPASDGAPAVIAETVPTEASSPESEQALVHAHQLLERAATLHRWGDSDNAELRQAIAAMNGSARLEIMQAFAAALNRGDFKGTLSAVFFQ